MLGRRLALVLALVSLAAAPAVAEPVESRNLAWLLALAGFDAAPGSEALVHAGGDATPMPASDAFAALAARADGVDLSALDAEDGPSPAGVQVGDVWILEIGAAPCPAPVAYAPTPVPSMTPSPGLWIYEGGAGASRTSESRFGVMFSWTLKTFARYEGGGHTMAGQSDFYCVEVADVRVSFPFLDGVAWPNQMA